MKQYISESQINELNDDQAEKLSKWFYPKYMNEHGLSWIAGNNNSKYPLPRLTIGQMIEFLGEDINLQSDIEQAGGMGKRVWTVFFHYEGVTKTEPELVDALWEACKEVLDN